MPQFTLSQLVQRAYDRIDNNQVLWPQQQVIDAINEALRLVNLLVGFSQTTVILNPSEAGRYFYDVPLSVLYPISIYFNTRALSKRSWDDFAQFQQTWLSDNTGNAGPVNIWVCVGFCKFAIYPADLNGGNTIQVTGISTSTLLVNLTDVVTIPDEYVQCIDDLAQGVLTFKIGGKVFADSTAAYQRFMGQIKEFVTARVVNWPRYWLILSEGQKK